MGIFERLLTWLLSLVATKKPAHTVTDEDDDIYVRWESWELDRDGSNPTDRIRCSRLRLFPVGTTVADAFSRVETDEPSDYLVQVNGHYAAGDDVLKDRDFVRVWPRDWGWTPDGDPGLRPNIEAAVKCKREDEQFDDRGDDDEDWFDEDYEEGGYRW